jgi:hypothetical protein
MNDFGKNLKNEMGKQFSNELGKVLGANSPNITDFLQTADKTMKSVETKESKKIFKKSEIDEIKMDKPIGKLYSIGKTESKEAMSSGAAGSFEAPLSGEMKEKWSQKYKDSIDCDNPKGFSQRAHCQGEVKKTETKEATASNAMGAYDAPGFEDVKMKGNNPIGRGSSFKKTQIPGGGFVTVKDKCKKFPYCNQGIDALNITKSKKSLKEMISIASKKYQISESLIIKFLKKEYNIK